MKKILINNKEYVFDITRGTYEGLSAKRRKQYREDLKDKLKKQFNDKTNDVVKRFLKIQDLLVIKKLPCHDLVYEAKMLYVEGYFYSTIALCGVVGENIARMILNDSEITVNRSKIVKGKTIFGRLDFVAINKILINASLIQQDSYKKLEKIRKLRNKYVHGNKLFNPVTAKKDAGILLNSIVTILRSEFKP